MTQTVAGWNLNKFQNTIGCQNICFTNYSHKTLHISPLRVRCGVTSMSPQPDLYPTLILSLPDYMHYCVIIRSAIMSFHIVILQLLFIVLIIQYHISIKISWLLLLRISVPGTRLWMLIRLSSDLENLNFLLSRWRSLELLTPWQTRQIAPQQNRNGWLSMYCGRPQNI